ncbi:hypothetical protein PPERSA_10658 [Pseudocohnilembus persalinus]|uniref:Insulin-like growth factor binding protein, N-terminal n=1 Tax=Pseudocohnilembus persalinus TaxID=266149 RepID=A0A0V0QD63_PSEPJ|nr:hypothetical protein PPERSA_10658 [Pseudocohnilembus persalinus]|eukprot:KRX00159.1 hypothetical protein PPERSA_10658 [Pseudocohnilembus persalinus]
MQASISAPEDFTDDYYWIVFNDISSVIDTGNTVVQSIEEQVYNYGILIAQSQDGQLIGFLPSNSAACDEVVLFSFALPSANYQDLVLVHGTDYVISLQDTNQIIVLKYDNTNQSISQISSYSPSLSGAITVLKPSSFYQFMIGTDDGIVKKYEIKEETDGSLTISEFEQLNVNPDKNISLNPIKDLYYDEVTFTAYILQEDPQLRIEMSCGYRCNSCKMSGSSPECEQCQDGYYIDEQGDDKCKDCEEGCSMCDHEFCTDCYDGYEFQPATSDCALITCDPGYELDENYDCQLITCDPGYELDEHYDCQLITCDPGYELDENYDCQIITCDPGYELDENYDCQLITCDPGYELDENYDCQIITCDPGYELDENYDCQLITCQQGYQLDSNYKCQQITCQDGYEFDKNNQCVKKCGPNQKLNNNNICEDQCKSGHLKNEEGKCVLDDSQINPSVKSTTQNVATASAFVSTSLIPLSYSGKLKFLISMVDFTQLLYMLIYLNFNYSPNVFAFFKSLEAFQLNFIPNLFGAFCNLNVDDQYDNFPTRFQDYGLSSQFITNAGGSFLLIGAPFLFYIGVLLIQKFMQKLQYTNKVYMLAKKILQNITIGMKYGTFIDLIFTDYLTDITAFFLQFYTISQINFNSAQNNLNILLWIISSASLLVFPFYFMFRVLKYYKQRQQSFYQKYKNFWDGLNQDRKSAIVFNFFLYFRKILYGLCISLFYNQTNFQLLFLVIIHIALILIMLVSKPFQTYGALFVNFATEGVFLLVIWMIFFNCDEDKCTDDGYVIIYSSVIILCMHLLLTAHTLLQPFLSKLIYLLSKKHNRRKVGEKRKAILEEDILKQQISKLPLYLLRQPEKDYQQSELQIQENYAKLQQQDKSSNEDTSTNRQKKQQILLQNLNSDDNLTSKSNQQSQQSLIKKLSPEFIETGLPLAQKAIRKILNSKTIEINSQMNDFGHSKSVVDKQKKSFIFNDPNEMTCNFSFFNQQQNKKKSFENQDLNFQQQQNIYQQNAQVQSYNQSSQNLSPNLSCQDSQIKMYQLSDFNLQQQYEKDSQRSNLIECLDKNENNSYKNFNTQNSGRSRNRQQSRKRNKINSSSIFKNLSQHFTLNLSKTSEQNNSITNSEQKLQQYTPNKDQDNKIIEDNNEIVSFYNQEDKNLYQKNINNTFEEFDQEQIKYKQDDFTQIEQLLLSNQNFKKKNVKSEILNKNSNPDQVQNQRNTRKKQRSFYRKFKFDI